MFGVSIKRKLALGLFLFSSFACPLFASTDSDLPEEASPELVGESCPERVARSAPFRESTLTIWNYFGREDFKTASILELLSSDEGYYSSNRGVATIDGSFLIGPSTYARRIGAYTSMPFADINPVRSEVSSASRGDTLIDRNQFFPLQVMVDTGYIDEQLRDAQAEEINRISPNQLMFFEVTSRHSGSELMESHGKVPEVAREDALHRAVEDYFSHFAWGDGVREARPPVYQLKEGAAWILSGQPLRQKLSLYLETPDMVVPIDREKFRYVWEIGRAAQTRTRAFFETLRTSLFYITRELLLMGGKPEEAFLFGHSLNPQIGSVYRRIYAMTDHSTYKNKPGELAHVSCLEDTLRNIDIAPVHPQVRHLMQVGAGQLSSVEAMGMWLFAQQSRTEYLSPDNAASTGDEVRIQLRDFSTLSAHLIERQFVRHPFFQAPMPEQRSDAMKAFMRLSPVMEFRDRLVEYAERGSYPYELMIKGRKVRKLDHNTQRYFDVLQNVHEYAGEFNAIEVSAIGKISGDELLAAAYLRVAERLKEQGVEDPLAFLTENEIRFTLFDHAAGVPSSFPKWELYRPAIEVMKGDMFFGSYKETIVSRIYRSALTYTAEQAAGVASGVRSGLGRFVRGDAHLKEYFSNADLMF